MLHRSFGFIALVAVLVIAGTILGRSSGTARAQDPEPILINADTPISAEDVRNLSYPSTFTAGGDAPLSDGLYSEPAAPGSAAQVTVRFQRAAFGALDGAPAAAVVLSTNAGGSGTFFELHLVTRDEQNNPQAVAQRQLGDRIRLQDLRLAQQTLRVAFTGFTPTDPFCCPSLNTVHEFQLIDGEIRLARGHQAPALLAVPEGPSLMGWYGAPTTSLAILASAPFLDVIWAFDADLDIWVGDGRDLPAALRRPIAINQGTGVFVVARTATDVPVPLLAAPDACPLNPGPPHPVDPSMIVQQPGAGEELSGAIPVAGLARVFEANVRIRVLTAEGTVLADTFTTASVGGPEFGQFASDVAVSVTTPTAACVQIFEESARDGSQVNVVQTQVMLQPQE